MGSLARIPPYWPRKWPPIAVTSCRNDITSVRRNNCLPFDNPRDSPVVVLRWIESWLRHPDFGLAKTNDTYLWQRYLLWFMQYAVLRAVNCTTQLVFMSLCTDRHPVTPSPDRQYQTAWLRRSWCRKCADSTVWYRLVATTWSLTLKIFSFSFYWFTYSSHSYSF